MTVVESRTKWIMLVAGAVTCTMAWAAIAPQAALLSLFSEALTGPLADLVARSWGALIALIGAMLIYGAFVPGVRAMVLVVAGVSKLVFIGLVLSHGGRYVGRQAGIAVAVDLVWVALFAWYLAAARVGAQT
jgi:hypothetical protein